VAKQYGQVMQDFVEVEDVAKLREEINIKVDTSRREYDGNNY
jgi:hypothetical protein